MVAAIDARARGDGTWEVVVAGGRTPTGLDAVAWARRVQELGAGVPLPAPTPAAIHQALSLVLADPAFQHSAQHISEGFRAAGGYRRGADKILEAAMGSAPLP